MIILLCVSGVLNGEEQRKMERLEMPDGSVYENVTVTSYSPAWVKIMHRSGVSKLMLSECDEEMQELYSYDAGKAEAYLSAENAMSKRAAKKRAEQRLVDAKKMEEKAKVKQEKEREYLEYKKAQARDKKEAEFLKKVAYAAVKVDVTAEQNAEIGLIGKVTVFKKEYGEKPGSSFEKIRKWKVVKSVDGAVSGTSDTSVLEVDGETLVTWSGKAWEIGTITYKSVVGVEMSCAHFTASQAEAEAYYRAKLKQK